MSQDRIITADASKVTPLEFFEAIFGKEPEAEKAARIAYGQALQAKRRAEDAELTELMRQRAADIIARDRAKREGLLDHPAESLRDPLNRKAA